MPVLAVLRAAAVLCLFVLMAVLAAVAGARVWGGAAVVVTGGSMEPTIPLGAVVFVKAAAAYRPGDVVTYRQTATALTTHRVLRVHGSGPAASFVTKGDANADPDSDEVSVGAVRGAVRGHLPGAGYVLAVGSTPGGRLVLLGIPMLWLLTEQVSVLLGLRSGSGPTAARRARS